jgi:hypothetical protein
VLFKFQVAEKSKAPAESSLVDDIQSINFEALPENKWQNSA